MESSCLDERQQLWWGAGSESYVLFKYRHLENNVKPNLLVCTKMTSVVNVLCSFVAHKCFTVGESLRC